MNKKVPKKCPSCDHPLKIAELHCSYCETKISGSFDLPVLACLQEEEQQLILDFVKYSGSLKEMANHLKLSYPTVRNMLDEIIEKIIKLETNITKINSL
jgi:hypothetical protein